jgi:cell division protein FtsI/penicillin-binding protein 2
MSLLRILIRGVAVVLILTLLGFRLHTLQQKFRDQKAASGDAIKTEDALLFYQLLDAGLIAPGPDGICLEMAPADLVLIKRAGQQAPPDESDTDTLANEARLLKNLYGSGAGSAVRAQVRLWNETHRLTAIRDNRPRQIGATRNQWQARDPRQAVRRVRSGSLVPESFGFVNQGRLRPFFSDWLTGRTSAEQVEFQTFIEVQKPIQLEVQLIGKPVRINPKPKIQRRCPPDDSGCVRKSALAFSLTFSLSPGKHELIVVASSIVHEEPKIPGLSIYNDKKGFQWQSLPPPKMGRLKPVRLATGDGTWLTDESGNPTTFCQEAGLVAVVGCGVQDTFSLTGILAASDLPSSLTLAGLTFDGHIQKVAQQVLLDRIKHYWPTSRHADERRAAVVILDADSGAILAAAGHPSPPVGAHPWDLVSFAKVYPVKSPLIVRAWQGLDKHCAPGSTYKPLVALSALKASKYRDDLAGFIEGYGPHKLSRKTGLHSGCATYQPSTGRCFSAGSVPGGVIRRISNFNSLPLGTGYRKKAGKCSQSGGRSMGLTEAVRDSINVWFARLAVMMDGEKAVVYQKTLAGRPGNASLPDLPKFELLDMAETLGFGELPLDLAQNLPAAIHLQRRPFNKGIWKNRRRIGVQEGDALYAHPGVSDLMFSRQLGLQALWGLAQNSIGQGMTASPLQMARVAAAVATGKRVQPHLFSSWGEATLDPPQGGKLGIEDGKLQILRNAMQAVPDAGTARGAFRNPDHPDLCRVYGKTGTANVAGSPETTWFVGWREPEAQGERRLAFACMVTHCYGRYNTGGEVCAPIVAQILKEL